MKKLFLLLSMVAVASLDHFAKAEASKMTAIHVAEPPDDTYYYEYSSVLFGTDVDANGEIVNESSEFKLPSSGPAKIAVLVENDEPFLTEKVYVEIYNEDNELVEDFNLELKPEWNWFKFVIELEKPGSYFVDIYNEIDVFINSGTVEVYK